jgi:hypothetical protein
VYTRFLREDCDRHEISIWVNIFTKKLTFIEESHGAQNRAEASYKLFEYFDNPRAYIIPMRHVNFKMATIERLLYFSNTADMRTLGVATDVSRKVSSLSKRLIPKMLSLTHIPMKNKGTYRIQIV